MAKIAKKVLSQPISSSSAERNWSTYSYTHNVKRNRSNSIRANNLVFIHSNIYLRVHLCESYKDGPYKKWDIDPDNICLVDSTIRLEDMRWRDLKDKYEDTQHVAEVQETSSNTSLVVPSKEAFKLPKYHAEGKIGKEKAT